MPIAHLVDRAVLEVTGTDAATFLNGLLTNDIIAMPQGSICYAGLLSPQGKALFDLFAVRDAEGFLLDVAASRVADLLKKLSMYKLRADVSLSLRPDVWVFAGWGEQPLPENAVPDPRLPAMGWRSMTPAGNPLGLSLSKGDCSNLTDYHTHRISHAIPDSSDIGADQLLWLETNADLLHGVSFTKGCYVGQENTARMHHRGKVRKRICRVTSTEGLPERGTTIYASEKEAGHLLSVMGDQGLALMRLEFVESGAALTTADEPVRLDVTNYLTSAFS